MNKNITITVKEQDPPKIFRRIGSTTYEVFIHFNETSTETIADKIKRLMLNDCEKNFKEIS